MKCWNCGSAKIVTEKRPNGKSVCSECKTTLRENGKDTKPLNIGSVTMNVKIGETPSVFAEELAQLLYEHGVDRYTIEAVEDLIVKRLVIEKAK